MTSVELLKHQSELAFADFIEALEGVTERQAWALLPPAGSNYLHTDGSIHGLVLHVASGKRIYGSVAFRSSEIRWRHCADEIERFEPSWSAAVDYLHDSQRYWLSTWEHLTDEELDREVPHFSGKLWPAWKVIRMVTHHDAWHGGQIAVFRYASLESDIPPPSVAEDIRKYCKDLPSW